ncbi:MAG: hypothetical protein GTO14_15060 [Anaerolineales bacterium]|nr:hypothetical protein [Anaerolineales bacterium]
MTLFRPELPREARAAIMQYAFFRWENAVVIAGTILLTVLVPTPFPWWPRWGWPLLGVLSMAAIVFSSVTNAEFNARMLLKFFQAQFNLRRVQNLELRGEVESALEYQRRIFEKARRGSSSVLWDRAEDTANQLNDWIRNIYRLAIRLDAYQRDALLHQEQSEVPQEIENLRARLGRETSPAVLKQVGEVLESKEKQWQTLKALETRMKQAELSLDQSLTALATVDSQVQLIDAEDVRSGRAERLREDIREQILRLDDLVSSINEVYDYNARGVRGMNASTSG